MDNEKLIQEKMKKELVFIAGETSKEDLEYQYIKLFSFIFKENLYDSYLKYIDDEQMEKENV